MDDFKPMPPYRPVDDFFPGRRESIATGTCQMLNVGRCAGDGTATEFRDALSRKEYGISGMCQKCQDSVFGV